MNNSHDSLAALSVDSLGNLYACGIENIDAGVYQWQIRKFSPLGVEDTVNWGTSFADGSLYACEVDRNGNLAVLGYSASDGGILVKFSPEGEVLWQADSDDNPKKLVFDADNNLFYTHFTIGSEADLVVRKYTEEGVESTDGWPLVAFIDNSGDHYEMGGALDIASNGDLLVGGQREGVGYYDWWLLRVTADGNRVAGNWADLE